MCLILWLLSLLICFISLDVSNVSAQLDSSQLRMLQRARHSIVIIHSNNRNRVGTGSIIKVDGRRAYVLTAYHVLTRSENLNDPDHNMLSEEVEVELFTGLRLKAIPSSRWIDTNNDVALFALDNLPSDSIPPLLSGASSSARDGQQFHCLGHSNQGTTWFRSTCEVGRIDRGIIFFTPPLPSGFSGAPLINDQGQFVGMVQARQDVASTALPWELIYPIIRGWLNEGFVPEPVIETKICQYTRLQTNYIGCTFGRFTSFHPDINPEGYQFQNASGLPDWIMMGLSEQGIFLKNILIKAVRNGFKNLKEANLQDANLSGANLRSCDFSGANLKGANLRNADLQDANLHRVDLYKATWVNGKVCQPGSISVCRY